MPASWCSDGTNVIMHARVRDARSNATFLWRMAVSPPLAVVTWNKPPPPLSL